ncbi:TolC family outer membrane protein [Photobacterium lucens]|uniref:TolC family outer membrane protein n=1 Tax=Photobacterium lucens TaxID=2562949 RepID=UPI0013710DF9|nr:TolC family outer membrane protein [Photobacterium lucens]MBP2698701.1 TolC family outer membrane protein [Vibrio parahaemolyticus]MZG56774.1 agglutination protein [Photobacterium lucens]MZG82506.1 agglutination protein [Photobacterium lucens]
MRLSSLIAVALFSSSAAHALSLEESVASAIDYSPQIAGQYARYQSVLREVDGAQADYLPQVNLYAAAGYEETRYNSGNKIPKDDRGMNRTEVGFKASQLIFDGFKTSANTNRLSHEAESERLTLLSDAEDISLDTTRLYLEVLKAKTIHELTQRNVREHEAIYQDILDKNSKGLSSNSDLAQIAARVATAQSSLIAAENNLYDLDAQFMRLVGKPASGLVDPVVDTALLPSSKEIAVKQGIEQHPEIQAAIADIKATREEIRREKGNYFPEFKLEVHANANDNVGNTLGPDQDARVMLTMNYDIYNGGKTNADTEASAWRHEEARTVRLRAEREVVEGTTLAWNAYNMLEQQKKLLKQNVDAAKAAEMGYEEQFRLGRRSLLDVLDAKVEVFLARKNFIHTEYDHTLAAYRILNAMGKLTYALRVEYPEQWQAKEQ